METFELTRKPKTPENRFFGEGPAECYYVNDLEAPTFNLLRGKTYKFIIKTPLFPFYFTSSDVGGSGFADSLMNSTKPTDNGSFIFTVLPSMPESFWYQCGIHPKMGGRVHVFEDNSEPHKATTPMTPRPVSLPDPPTGSAQGPDSVPLPTGSSVGSHKIPLSSSQGRKKKPVGSFTILDNLNTPNAKVGKKPVLPPPGQFGVESTPSGSKQDSPKTTSKSKSPSPKTRSESPKARPPSPKTPPDSPKPRHHSDRVRPETPKTRPESPRARPESPRTRPESPKRTPKPSGGSPKSSPGRHSPERASPGRASPGRHSPERHSPGRHSPGRTPSLFTIREKYEGFKDISIIGSAPGEDALYVVEQRGIIYKITGSRIRKFLDITHACIPLNEDYDERGLLGLAFHREYFNVKSPYYGRFYVFYSSPIGNATNDEYFNILSEFRSFDLNDSLPRTETQILKIFKTKPINNGGALLFHPDDGMLYVSVGDDNQPNQVQKLNTFYGKILRINVATLPYQIPLDNPFVRRKDASGEIYAYGFKNVVKLSYRDHLLACDMSQGKWEEINRVESGRNYGWPHKEGFEYVSSPVIGDAYEYTDPVFVYSFRDEYTGIIGGEFVGHQADDSGDPTPMYVFGDLCGRLMCIRGQQLVETAFINRNILAFGSSSDGTVYLATSELAKPHYASISVLKVD